MSGFPPFEFVNQLMIEDGFKAIRSNSILCTGNIKIASEYGEIFRVFPIGDFHYAWSDKVDDYLYYIRKIKSYRDEFQIMNDKRDQKKWIKENFWDKTNYQQTNLKKAIQSKNEIMITGKDYYAVNLEINRDFEI